MTGNKPGLSRHISNVFSQTGEDGVIEFILETLPEKDKWCVEFGAWDGMYLSNARNLIEKLGYSSVLIEGSETKYLDLKKNYADRENVHTMHAFVGFNKDDNLDTLLSGIPIPTSFDFLSIDVDGNDFHIWKAIEKYRPKAVCIEFNPTIPTEVRFVQLADPNTNHGSSLRAIVELGREKGYELVEVLPFNAFFVDAKYYDLFDIEDNRPETLRKDLSYITYIFSGYDGRVFLDGNKKLPWHGVQIEETRIQRLPRPLRKYKKNYTRFEKRMFRAFLILDKLLFGMITLIFSPKRFLNIIRQRRSNQT